MARSFMDGRYWRVMRPWHDLGFNVIPARPDGKAPRVAGWGAWHSPGCAQIGFEQQEQWARQWPDARALLLPASGQHVQMVGVDIDDLAVAAWARDTFGATALMVTTGREGGGAHWYYRRPPVEKVSSRNGCIGPRESIPWPTTVHEDGRTVADYKNQADGGRGFGRTPIDLKTDGAYLVAPGSVHKSGRIYTPSVPMEEITVEFLQSLPEFDVEAYERAWAEMQSWRNEKLAELVATWPKTPRAARRKSSQGKRSAPPKSARVGPAPARELPDLDDDTTWAGDIGALRGCPFIDWCIEFPTLVNLCTWRALSTNIAKLGGEDGRLLFHAISALDPDAYAYRNADAEYTRALQRIATGGLLTGYARCIAEGWPGACWREGTFGDLPEEGCPAARVVAFRNRRAAAELVLKPDVVGDGGFFPPFELRTKATILCGTTGSGKTTRTAEQAQTFDVVTVITPRIALTEQSAVNFHCVSYKDAEHEITDPRAAVCLPSIGRRVTPVAGRSLLILDESEQILQILVSDGIAGTRSPKLIRVLRRLIAEHDHVICARRKCIRCHAGHARTVGRCAGRHHRAPTSRPRLDEAGRAFQHEGTGIRAPGALPVARQAR